MSRFLRLKDFFFQRLNETKKMIALKENFVDREIVMKRKVWCFLKCSNFFV